MTPNVYVISQRATPDAAYQEGNLLHIIKVMPDGDLVEEVDPININVPYTTRPQGIIFGN